MKPSIFTKIINGELPCYKIFEDERTFAFLNINPIQPGHLLVVPKVQVDHLEDLDEEDYYAVMKTVKFLMQHIRDELQVERACLRVEGFEVAHAHVHIIPCATEAEVMSSAYEADQEELAEMHERLSF